LPKGGEASTQAGRRGFTRGIFCRHDDVDCRQIQLREAKGFSDQATDAISRDAAAHRFDRDRESHPRTRAPVRHDAKTEEAIVDATTARVYRVELELATQARFRA
jgi:hypothetical protein